MLRGRYLNVIDGDPLTGGIAERRGATRSSRSIWARRGALAPFGTALALFRRLSSRAGDRDVARWVVLAGRMEGKPYRRVIFAGFEKPKWPSMVFSFDPRPARYVRFRHDRSGTPVSIGLWRSWRSRAAGSKA